MWSFGSRHVGFSRLRRGWARLALLPRLAAIAVAVATLEFRRVFFLFFEEIRDVEKSVALEAEVDKRGLHAGKNPGDTALVNGAG